MLFSSRIVPQKLIGRSLLFSCLLAPLALVAMKNPQSQGSTANIRKIQSEYQQLLKELYAEEAKIQGQRADYGVQSAKDIRQTIDDLIAVIKNTPPGEDSGEPLTHYLEFLNRMKELVHTAVGTLDGIADSKIVLTEKDLKLQKLNQDLVKATAAMKATLDVSNRVVNPPVTLEPIPYPERDWTELDRAIDGMKKEDLSALPSNPPLTGQEYERERQKYLAAYNAASQVFQVCLKKIPICFNSCVAAGDTSTPGKWLARETQCGQQCGNCKAEEAALIKAQQAQYDFEKANNYGYPKSKQ